MAGTRLVLGDEVRAGNEHTAKHTQPGLLRPSTIFRWRKAEVGTGDSAFGNDPLMTALEAQREATCSSSNSQKTSNVTSAASFANRAGPTQDKGGKAWTANLRLQAGRQSAGSWSSAERLLAKS